MKYACFIILTALLISGCGSSSTDAGSLPQPQDNDYRGLVVGRVLVPSPLPDARVEFITPDGAVIHELKTNRRGWFLLRAVVPPDFSVKVYSGQDVYAAEVRGGWHRGTLYVNAATTLQSAYMRAHPEVSFADAQQRVHNFLKLPSHFKLKWVSVVRTSSFDPVAFFQQASRAGGLQAYLDSLVREIDGSVARKFLLDVAGSLLGSAAGALYSNTVNDAAGSVVSKMGLNFTTASALSSLLSGLNQVTVDLQNLTNEVNQAAALAQLTTTTQPMDTAVANITELTKRIYGVTEDFADAHGPGQLPYNAPEFSNTELNTLRSQFNESQLLSQVNAIAGPLVAANSAQLQFAAAQTSIYNFDDAGTYQNYPWRGNYLTLQQQNFVAKYCNALAQGANLGCELAHIQFPNGAALFTATNTVQGIGSNIQLAAQQVPDQLPADDVLFDAGNSVYWYAEFLEATDWQTASDFAYDLEVGPLGEGRGDNGAGLWTLPGEGQLQNLLMLPRVLPQNPSIVVNSGPEWNDYDSSDFYNAFAHLGFDITYYGAFYDKGNPNKSNDEGSWIAQTYCNCEDQCNETIYFWNNTGNNPSTNCEPTYNTTNTCPFLVMYSYPSSDEPNAPTSPLTSLLPLSDTSEGVLSPFATGMLNGAPQVSVAGQNSLGTQLKALQSFVAGGPSNGSTAFGTGPFDVTARVAWQSSNPAVASVSNLVPTSPPPQASALPLPSAPPGPCGFVTWHPSLTGSALPPVTITASLFGQTSTAGTAAQVVNGSLTLSPPAGLKPVLSQVVLVPINTITNLTVTPTATVNVQLTAFYADGQFVDVSYDANTTWTARDANGNLLNSPNVGGFGPNVLNTTFPNLLRLTSNITTSNISVSATYSGPYGSASTSGNLGIATIAQPSPTPTPTPTPGGSPTMTGLTVTPATVTYPALPASGTYRATATFTDGSSQDVTQLALWQLQLPNNGGPVPSSQGFVSLTSEGLTATLTPSFTGTGAVVVAAYNGFFNTGRLTQASSRVTGRPRTVKRKASSGRWKPPE